MGWLPALIPNEKAPAETLEHPKISSSTGFWVLQHSSEGHTQYSHPQILAGSAAKKRQGHLALHIGRPNAWLLSFRPFGDRVPGPQAWDPVLPIRPPPTPPA